jgi:hypothetical protein
MNSKEQPSQSTDISVAEQKPEKKNDQNADQSYDQHYGPKKLATATKNTGDVIAVRGSVVDIAFTDQLPPIRSLLHAGDNNQISIEVFSQLDSHRVRGIALTSI